MRRRITLYIGGVAADLSDDSLVLFDWQITDLTNPAAVRNSYSKEIDLPRTGNNAAIFGASYRLDRNAGSGGTGPAFNASRRTPFSIFAETGDVLAAGYCKLVSVSRDAYRVALFGGLGDFLYGLSYDAEGNKLTLADLDFGVDLDFTIDAGTVAEAWARLAGDDEKPSKWDVINFAPCYDGVPDDFEAAKALARPEEVGLSVPAGKTTKGGYVLVNLPEEADGWAAHDMRSYLQRPVVSMAKILEAVANPANNGGWYVDLSDVANVPYRQSWLTRPLLPSLGTYKSGGKGIAFRFSGSALTTGEIVGTFLAEETPPVGEEVTVKMSFRIGYEVREAAGAARLQAYTAGENSWTEQLLFIQAVGYDADGIKVAAGPSLAVFQHALPVGGVSFTAEQMAQVSGYQPDALNNTILDGVRDHAYDRDGSGFAYLQREPVELEITGENIARIDLKVTSYNVIGAGSLIIIATHPTDSCAAGSFLWSETGDTYTLNQAYSADGVAEASAGGSDTLRSGAAVTKAMLLTTAHTPAEYLVGFCKMAGLSLLCDGAARTVKVLRRASLYNGPTLDLSQRVDRSQGAPVRPLTFDRKWYEWKAPSVGGRFEELYRKTEGVDYGVQRVDTGYEFDAEARNVLEGLPFNQCAAVCDRSPYWFQVTDGTIIKPALFRMPGGTFTVWDADGNSEDVGISVPSDAASLEPYDTQFPGYDPMSRAEFRDADNGPVDGSDVLLFHTYSMHYDQFALTDDVPAMDSLAGGPCWLLGLNADGLDLPQFTRYTHQGQDPLVLLDFGYPRQTDIPGIDYGNGKTIYAAAWADYIRDRLSVHGKVLTARVDFSGLQVGTGLLRAFWWYEGSLWVLSKIANYSLTTFDPAECEFIQVRDISAYKSGQSF